MNIQQEIEQAKEAYRQEKEEMEKLLFRDFPIELPKNWHPNLSVQFNMEIDRYHLNGSLK